jgi:hypothetical protein
MISPMRLRSGGPPAFTTAPVRSTWTGLEHFR